MHLNMLKMHENTLKNLIRYLTKFGWPWTNFCNFLQFSPYIFYNYKIIAKKIENFTKSPIHGLTNLEIPFQDLKIFKILFLGP